MKAGSWPAGAFTDQTASRDVDLTAGIAKPGEYEAVFRPAHPGAEIEIQEAELLIAGRPIPDRVRRLPGGAALGLYRMEQTAPGSPTVPRIKARMAASAPGSGSIFIRLR